MYLGSTLAQPKGLGTSTFLFLGLTFLSGQECEGSTVLYTPGVVQGSRGLARAPEPLHLPHLEQAGLLP